MSLDLDDETRESLGWSPSPMDPSNEASGWLWTLKESKRDADRKRQRDLRDSKAVKIQEAKYQRTYAQTPDGKARRYAAKVAYRRRQRAASGKAAPGSTGTPVQVDNAHQEAT